MSFTNEIKSITTDRGAKLTVCGYCGTLDTVPDVDTLAKAGSAEVIARHRDATCVAGASYEGVGNGRPQ